MNEKIVGYVLLIIGVLIIIFSAVSVFSVFTKKSEPINLFNLKGIVIDSNALTPQLDLSTVPDLNIPQKQVSKAIEIIPADTLNSSANIFAHLALMGFLLSVGGQIAAIGTNLLRPIVVKTPHEVLETTREI